MNLERYVWLVALVRHFDVRARERASIDAVLGALGVTVADLEAARKVHEAPRVTALVRGDDAPAKELAKALARADEAVRSADPKLDDLRHKPALAPGDVDETAFLRLVVPIDPLPFRAGPSDPPPPSRAEWTTPPEGSSEETLVMPLVAVVGQALPFGGPPERGGSR